MNALPLLAIERHFSGHRISSNATSLPETPLYGDSLIESRLLKLIQQNVKDSVRETLSNFGFQCYFAANPPHKFFAPCDLPNNL